MDEDKECIDCGSKADDVEMRWPGYGYKSFLRCKECGAKRIEREEKNKRKYFGPRPADFDEMDAGESWDEEDY